MSKKMMGITGLLIVFLILISVNTVSNNLLRGKRMDLTSNKLYTLTQGSKNIASKLEEPIKLRFYFSEKLTNNIPNLKSYGTRVRELLQEFEALSGGKIKLEVIDPVPFSEAEEKAVVAGMQAVPLNRSENIYFGLEGVSSTDVVQTIPFFNQEKEEFLEYDIAQLVYNLNNPAKRKVTILTGLPIQGSMDYMARMQGREVEEPWVIVQQLQKQYEVEVLDYQTPEIPAGTDVLMLIHPKDLTSTISYGIDQYVLNGGRVIVFVDPHSEAEQPPQDPQNPMAAMNAPRSSDLPEIFKAWGVELVKDKVAADRKRALQIPTGNQARPKIVNFVPYLNLIEEDINQTEVMTSQLRNLNIGMAGILRKVEGGTTEITPLLETTTESMELNVEQVRMFPDPEKLFNDFVSQDKKITLAARVTGSVKTAYPDGPEGGSKAASHLDESTGPINALIFTDVDFLADRFWVQTQRFFGQTMLIPIAQNGDLVINAVDALSGSNDLINIRSRGKFNRPFERVRQLEEKALAKFAEQEKALQAKLEETDTKLRELQQARGDNASALVLSDEQRQEIEKFQEEKVQTNRELRRVQLALRQDIETLGQKLKFINIGLIPLLVSLLAVGVGIVRVNRRRRR